MSTRNTKHAVFADGLSCAAKLQNLAIWWHKINKLRPKISYLSKPCFAVKQERYDIATNTFTETTLI